MQLFAFSQDLRFSNDVLLIVAENSSEAKLKLKKYLDQHPSIEQDSWKMKIVLSKVDDDVFSFDIDSLG